MVLWPKTSMADLPLMCVAFVILICLTCISEVCSDDQCPSRETCSCLGPMVDCSDSKLTKVPKDMVRIAAKWITILDLRSNEFTVLRGEEFQGLDKLDELEVGSNKLEKIEPSFFRALPNLTKLRLQYNEMTEIPNPGKNSNLTQLILHHNKLRTINKDALSWFPHLRLLDLNYNQITSLDPGMFPVMPDLRQLYINSNRIGHITVGALDNLNALEWLKLNKNRIRHLTKETFRNLSNLENLELNRNRMSLIDSLVFTGLKKLQLLKMKKNNISVLEDGAFWGLDDIKYLQMDHNKISKVAGGWLYGLGTLEQLTLKSNRIHSIDAKGWQFCKKLWRLDLTQNLLRRIEKDTFSQLARLKDLLLDHNFIAYIADGAFRGLFHLEVLSMNHNDIAWSIDDMDGAFDGLGRLSKLGLNSNRIKSIAKRAFHGLSRLKRLELVDNEISSVQSNAFEQMAVLQELKFNSSNLLCDCQLSWLPKWLKSNGFKNSVFAKCAHPEWLKGKSIFDVKYEQFRCDDVPSPVMISEPDSLIAVKGSNMTLTCTAASSGSKMTAYWKKDTKTLPFTNVDTFSTAGEGKLVKVTTILHLTNVTNESQGSYQCVIRNKLGIVKSREAQISVHVMPYFTKTPQPQTVRAGDEALLECQAVGEPEPEVSWQKDGGDDFPAARERRMMVDANQGMYYIKEVKGTDQGVYSCRATSEAGTSTYNITLTVLEEPKFVRPMKSETKAVGSTTVLECITSGSPKPEIVWLKDGAPFEVTPRHFLAANKQLLIIMRTETSDAGLYSCEVTNTLGTETESATLKVTNALPVNTDGPRYEPTNANQSMTTGIIIIAVVCCVVGTSLVWVIIIYQTRRRSEEYKSTGDSSDGKYSDIQQRDYPTGRSDVNGYPYGMYRQRPTAIFPSDIDDDNHRQSVPLTMDEQPTAQASDNSLNAIHHLRCPSETGSQLSHQSGPHSAPGSGLLLTFHPGPHSPVAAAQCQNTSPNTANTEVHAVHAASTSPQYIHTVKSRSPSEQHGAQPPGYDDDSETTHVPSATFPRSQHGPLPIRTRSEHSCLNRAERPPTLPLRVTVNPVHNMNVSSPPHISSPVHYEEDDVIPPTAAIPNNKTCASVDTDVFSLHQRKDHDTRTQML